MTKLSTPTRRCGVPTGAVGCSAPAVTGRGIYLAGTAAQERTANTVAHAGSGGGCLRAWTVDTTGHGSVVPASPRGRATGQSGSSCSLTWGVHRLTSQVSEQGAPGFIPNRTASTGAPNHPENADSRATPATERSAVRTPGA